ncbi:MAG TPA: PQQ-binding-like beta-propeller repeat protein [Vicinamibacterales bacterium]|nr:PQQ-binding-like beta-propeller repeat protein [Vicinamibacterales bacterium]
MRLSLALAALVAMLLVAVARPGAQRGPAGGDWPNHGGDAGSTKYSALDQITAANVGTLQIAWRRPGVDPALLAAHPKLVVPKNYRATPLAAGGLLFASNAIGLAEAFDPATGTTVWAQAAEADDLGGAGASRNLAYWTGSEDGGARVFNVRGRYLHAIDAKTGRPVAGFGAGGRVDLITGLGAKTTSFRWSAPGPLVVGDVVVIGGQGWTDSGTQADIPPGDVRAYDVRTGALRWTFHVVPRPGEPGLESWEQRSWRVTGSAKAWSLMSADPELGLIYVPLSSAANEWYGGQRPGANLYSDSLVCLDARTGELKWHFQTVHHDLWDYDNPTAPVVADITVNGTRIKAVVQVTKQAFAFVFDRVTGKPVWPIEERPVPTSTVPGEWTSPTQPFPTKPAPFDRQGLTDDDLIDFTPELKQEAREIVKQWTIGPMFTPPTVEGTAPGEKKGTMYLPGWVGGANWGGAAVDPETGVLYVPSVTFPWLGALVKGTGRFTYVQTRQRLDRQPGPGPRGLPITKPPYGRVTAIDLNSGDHLWMAANGDGPRDHPALRDLKLPPLGQMGRAAPLLTKTLLFVTEGSAVGLSIPPGGGGPRLRAFDKKTGQVVAEIALPAGATGAPMTYSHEGRQYIVVAVAGEDHEPELVALALPS